MINDFIKGKLSIIVPCYRVEDFIRECLDSLLNQTYKNIEVIMVDDGSPDNTGAILDEYDEKYTNFIAVHTPNGGLSAARNSGLKYVTGEFMAFVDSDDVVPLNAYEKMVGSLTQTGSDLATGFVYRFNSKKKYPSILHEKAIPSTVLKTNINTNTNLVYDTTAWNKVYKSSIFIGNNLKYPENLTYEDIPVSMKYHLLAKNVDIIAEDLYHWRVREGANQSITQQRVNFKLFEDRVKTLSLARQYLYELNGSPELKAAFDFKVLDMDIPLYLNSFQNASEETLFKFQQQLVQFLRDYDLSLIKELTIRKQIQYISLLNGDFKSFKQYGYQYKNIGNIELENDLYVYKNKILPKNITNKISPVKSLKVIQKLGKVYWKEDKLVIRGYVQFDQIAKFNKFNFDFKIKIANLDNNEFTYVNGNFIKKSKKSRMIHKVKYYLFEIELNPKNLKRKIGFGKWIVKLIGTDHNLSFETIIGHPLKMSRMIFRPRAILDTKEEFVFEDNFNKSWNLELMASENGYYHSRYKELPTFNKAEVKDNYLSFTLRSKTSLENAKLIFNDSSGKKIYGTLFLEENNPDDFEYRIDFNLDEFQSGLHWGVFKLLVNDTHGKQRYNVLPELNACLVEGKNTHMRITFNRQHDLYLYLEKDGIQASKVSIEDGFLNFEITNNADFDENSRLFIESTNKKEIYSGYTGKKTNKGTLAFHISLIDNDVPAIKKGLYNLSIESNTNNGERLPIIVDADNFDRQSIRKKSNDIRIYQDVIGRLKLKMIQHWGFMDKTVRRRRFNYRILYSLMRLLPLNKKTVILESFWGRSYDDNPRSIYEYWSQKHPDYKFIWPMTDSSIKVEGNGKVIRRSSLVYWYYLATAKYFIQNTNFPNGYVKRRGQIEVETLHGTFMKKMGLEEPNMRKSSAQGQRNFMKRNSRWDYLISPSKYMDDIGARAFDFKNEVLSYGFPRNDELINNNNLSFINKLKQNLNIPLDKKVVLYAPTYRQEGKLDFEMDLETMKNHLGDEWVVLVRLHHLVSNALDIHEYEGFAYDMSAYPNIADLYLLSDVLITDYSSVMFDYGYLQKPMIFFAYDLDWYLDDSNRGVYLDYQKTVPGPIAFNTQEIVESLEDLEGLKNGYQQKLDDFYNTFCTYGRDGDASEKVVEHIISKNIKNNYEEGYFKHKLEKALGITSLEQGIFNILARFINKRENIIIFESNDAKHINDSPRALYNYLSKKDYGYKLIWLADKDKINMFKEAKVPFVVKTSLKGLFTHVKARYYITNSNIPSNWRKPKGMKIIQTSNGIPLKKIGTDVSSDYIVGQTIYQYQKQQVIEGRKWDYLITGNNKSSELMKNSFRLSNKQVIMSGLPRIDELLSTIDDRDKLFAIKEKLGIDDSKKIVLYEPTWRDNEIRYVDSYGMISKVDFELLDRKLPDDVLFMVKYHPIISDGKPDFSGYKKIIDVSDYNINEDLLAIADVLVTDYSSVIFDFAVTEKPIIFMSPDLNKYENKIRGLYVDDYKDFVPGPVVKTTNDLINSIVSWHNNDEIWHDYREKEINFNLENNSWNDGNASKKVINYIFNQEKYVSRNVTNNIKIIKLQDGAALWSDVYGNKNTKFIRNYNELTDGQNEFEVISSSALYDPLNNLQVGNVFFKIHCNKEDVWVSELSIK